MIPARTNSASFNTDAAVFPTAPQGDFYEFGPFQVDVPARLLLRDSKPIRLPSKVFDTLAILIQSSGRIVSKSDILDRVWPECFVEEGSVTQNVCILRKVLGRGSDDQSIIETIPKHGYRFIAQVRLRNADAEISLEEPAKAPVSAPELIAAPAPRAIATRRVWSFFHRRATWAGAAAVLTCGIVWQVAAHLALAQHGVIPSAPAHSIAVLSLHNLSGRHESAWLAHALAEPLASELARGAVRTVAGEDAERLGTDLQLSQLDGLGKRSLAKIHEVLGADLVLTGSYLSLGTQVRIDLWLQDAISGETIGADSETTDEVNLLKAIPEIGARLRAAVAAVKPKPN